MEVVDLSLDGVKLIKPTLFPDERGLFYESYRFSRYQACGIDACFVQDNCSVSRKSCIRGMHFQPGQAKLVWVVKGKIFDVAVDIREGSPTSGKYEGVFLDDVSREQFYIPDGFAHGFCVLSEEAIVSYKVTADYDPEKERGFRFDDPTVRIDWPIRNPKLSKRDQEAPLFHEHVTI